MLTRGVRVHRIERVREQDRPARWPGPRRGRSGEDECRDDRGEKTISKSERLESARQKSAQAHLDHLAVSLLSVLRTNVRPE
jgi:hypothetical protein